MNVYFIVLFTVAYKTDTFLATYQPCLPAVKEARTDTLSDTQITRAAIEAEENMTGNNEEKMEEDSDMRTEAVEVKQDRALSQSQDMDDFETWITRVKNENDPTKSMFSETKDI